MPASSDPPYRDWKVGDPVYAAWSDRGGPRYVRGLGRVIRFEPPCYMILATKSGPERRVGVDDVGQFPTREQCEAWIKEHERPSGPGKPMAHNEHPVTSSSYECLRCERLLRGLDPMVPGHALRCPYRGTGRDPEPNG